MLTPLAVLGVAALTLQAAGALIAVIGLWRAPTGFEDDGGFHHQGR